MKTKNFLIDNKSRIINSLLTVLFVTVIVFFINSSGVLAASEVNTQAMFDKSYNELAGLVRQITGFMVGVSVISGVGTVVFHLTRLGASGGNPQARAKILQDLGVTGFCIALLGSFNLVLYFMVSIMNSMN